MKLKDVTHLRPQVLSAAMSFVPGHLFFSCQNVISGFFGNASITNKQTKIELKWKYQYSRYRFCCMIKVTHKMILLFFFMNQTDTWMNLNMFLKLCENALWSILCYMKLKYICSFKSTNCANVFLLKHCKGIFIFGNCLCLVWKYLFK